MKRIVVLRIGHRRKRDPRLSTHVALAARAFGARQMFFSGDEDPQLIQNIDRVVSNWGGDFKVQHVRSWKTFLKNWSLNGKSIHLTMYGANIQNVVEEIRSCNKDLLVIVGGQKVPRELYEFADWNVSITNQPHSEVSALAVFLHILLEGEELGIEFPGAKIIVNPCERGKNVFRSNA